MKPQIQAFGHGRLVTTMTSIAKDLSHIHEWGLGGRRFGRWVTWFLLGGDLYTAYTVIAIPAVVFAIGAYGFFAVPYTIIVYPFLYLTLPRLWAVSQKHGYITAADFVLGRYGHKGLELAVAATGVLATMPYIALQLVGLEKVILALGFHGQGVMAHAPIAAVPHPAPFTYMTGLRYAPAMITFDQRRDDLHFHHCRHDCHSLHPLAASGVFLRRRASV